MTLTIDIFAIHLNWAQLMRTVFAGFVARRQENLLSFPITGIWALSAPALTRERIYSRRKLKKC